PSFSSVELLREAARVLSPAGQLFLLARNRLNPMHLLQLSRKGSQGDGPDTAAVLAPRLPYRPSTRNGYVRLLADAGLRAETIYGMLPAVEEPYYVVPADQPGPMRFFLDSIFGS